MRRALVAILPDLNIDVSKTFFLNATLTQSMCQKIVILSYIFGLRWFLPCHVFWVRCTGLVTRITLHVLVVTTEIPQGCSNVRYTNISLLWQDTDFVSWFLVTLRIHTPAVFSTKVSFRLHFMHILAPKSILLPHFSHFSIQQKHPLASLFTVLSAQNSTLLLHFSPVLTLFGTKA